VLNRDVYKMDPNFGKSNNYLSVVSSDHQSKKSKNQNDSDYHVTDDEGSLQILPTVPVADPASPVAAITVSTPVPVPPVAVVTGEGKTDAGEDDQTPTSPKKEKEKRKQTEPTTPFGEKPTIGNENESENENDEKFVSENEIKNDGRKTKGNRKSQKVNNSTPNGNASSKFREHSSEHKTDNVVELRE